MRDAYDNYRRAIVLENKLVNEPDFAKQHEIHLTYTELVGKTKTDVEIYLGEDLEESVFALPPVRARDQAPNDGRGLYEIGEIITIKTAKASTKREIKIIDQSNNKVRKMYLQNLQKIINNVFAFRSRSQCGIRSLKCS